jgi:alpha-ketoglutarate-dependent taurine dioxygenase
VTATFEIDELHPALGVEVRGSDLREPMDESVAAALIQAYADHLLVFFRGQELPAGEQIRAVRLFGPIPDEFDDGSDLFRLDAGAACAACQSEKNHQSSSAPPEASGIWPDTKPGSVTPPTESARRTGT